MEVTIPGDGGDPDTPAYAALADGARRGMVVIHELFGRQPEIDRVVDRFAAAGYAAVGPDLFAGGLLPLCIARVVRAAATGEGLPIRQAEAARRWLVDRAGIDAGSVGLIGFCLGGGFALAAGRGWGAVSCNYGKVPPAPVMRGIGPVIGCFGGRDRAFAGEAATLRRRLTDLGVAHEVHSFPTVGHSFLTDGDHPVASRLSRPLLQISWDPQVAEEGWGHILRFFDEHLQPRA
ncbi:MAG TPA: dienelactone hydrolase family protein [Kofleriaceae bacterium]|nr:dienelactone hydrolase family protein [Kofleriaceae bacterium]